MVRRTIHRTIREKPPAPAPSGGTEPVSPSPPARWPRRPRQALVFARGRPTGGGEDDHEREGERGEQGERDDD